MTTYITRINGVGIESKNPEIFFKMVSSEINNHIKLLIKKGEFKKIENLYGG